MVRATITSKGQITIPKAVRDSLQLHAGDRIEFVVQGQNEAVLKLVSKSVDEVFGKLNRPGQVSKTVDEMNEATARTMRTRSR